MSVEQCIPVQPDVHEHCPVTGLQEAVLDLLHLQDWEQLEPNVKSVHSELRIKKNPEVYLNISQELSSFIFIIIFRIKKNKYTNNNNNKTGNETNLLLLTCAIMTVSLKTIHTSAAVSSNRIIAGSMI